MFSLMTYFATAFLSNLGPSLISDKVKILAIYVLIILYYIIYVSKLVHAFK